MTRTRRKYNFPNLIFYKWDIKLGWIPEWHPFHQWECGGNRKYKRYMTKQRHAANKTYTLRELKHCLENSLAKVG
jgi:hypothetical protein